MKIYVAGPYSPHSANPARELAVNIDRALFIGAELMIRGHDPFVPHVLGFALEQRVSSKGAEFDYERWMQWCMAWLKGSHGIYLIESSNGADRELVQAKRDGLQIFRNLEEVPWIS